MPEFLAVFNHDRKQNRVSPSETIAKIVSTTISSGAIAPIPETMAAVNYAEQFGGM